MIVVITTLVILPVVSPATGAQFADTLRGIFGPQAVAQLESISFKVEDIVNGVKYKLNGGQSQISFSDTTAAGAPAPGPADPAAATEQAVPATPEAQQLAALPAVTEQASPTAQDTSTQDVSTPAEAVPTDAPTPQPQATPAVAASATLVPTLAVPTATAPAPTATPNSALGWQPFGPTVTGQTVLVRTVVQPDPARPYAAAAIVRIDLTQTELHFVLGTKEPAAVQGVPYMQRSGTIPAPDQAANRLIAAFNGGFKTVSGHYGVYYQGITLVPFRPNLATLVLYRNGTVKIGAWGRDVSLTPDVLVARENCPLLVDAGNVNPDVNNENRAEWGYTIKNLDTSWRSAVGITQDGRYLIYAAGPSLTTASLARAMQQAGAYYAMQLDINGNGWFTRFATYTPATNPALTQFPVVASGLLKQMYVPPALFLTPDDRDFFYLTTRTS